MKIRIFLFLNFILISALELVAQNDRCGTNLIHEQNKTANPTLYNQQENFKKVVTQRIASKKLLKAVSAPEEIYYIPVVVHVVHNNLSKTIGGLNNPNISDAQIQSQIRILNEDYRKMINTNGYNTNPVGADTKIEFKLASIDPNGNYTNGITRTYNPQSSWAYSTNDEQLLKSLNYWPSDQYLNIWVCRLANKVLGYAQLPAGTSLPGLGSDDGAATDGVVIDYKAFGTGGATADPKNLYNLGRTCTHEVGHWLGLLHTWGDADCGDDFIADTPWDKQANNDEDCSDSSNCADPLVYTRDLIEDYMDYSIDKCMNIFTQGQKDRMRTTMETSPRRMALRNSAGLCADLVRDVPLMEDFELHSGASNDWTEQNTSNSNRWDTLSPGNESSSSIVFNNDISTPGDTNYLISPFIKFKNILPAMKFDLAYAQDPTLGTDTLVISYSVNCSNWTTLVKYYGSNLITTNTISSDFTPTNSDWKTIYTNINVFGNNPVGRFRFENHSNKKSKLYIDNINIYKTSSTIEINPYPGKLLGEVNVEVLFTGTQNVTFELYDLMGQKVFTQKDLQQNAYTRNFNFNGLTRGIYILRVSTDQYHTAKKIYIE